MFTYLVYRNTKRISRTILKIAFQLVFKILWKLEWPSFVLPFHLCRIGTVLLSAFFLRLELLPSATVCFCLTKIAYCIH